MISLVLGGARSGKSAVAESLAARGGRPVTYLATSAPPDPQLDPDWARRIAAHRARRPATWVTVEAAPERVIGEVARSTGHALLLDSLGAWVARAPGFVVDGDALGAALAGRTEPAVVVSDEVGLGVHPSTEAGRRFRDRLGELNRLVAEVADEAWLVVAGRVLPLDRLPR